MTPIQPREGSKPQELWRRGHRLGTSLRQSRRIELPIVAVFEPSLVGAQTGCQRLIGVAPQVGHHTLPCSAAVSFEPHINMDPTRTSLSNISPRRCLRTPAPRRQASPPASWRYRHVGVNGNSQDWHSCARSARGCRAKAGAGGDIQCHPAIPLRPRSSAVLAAMAWDERGRERVE